MTDSLESILAPYQLRVAKHLYNGLSLPEIAIIDYRGLSSIKTTVNRVYKKLGVHNRVEFCKVMQKYALREKDLHISVLTTALQIIEKGHPVEAAVAREALQYGAEYGAKTDGN